MAALAPKADFESAVETGASQDLNPASTKVLLVEDDSFALDELKDIVEFEGWTPKTAQSVDAALDLLAHDDSIQIIVTDVHFVDDFGQMTNGIQFVSRARAKFPNRSLTFIVLSGDQDAVVASTQEDAYEFLSKPLVPEELVGVLKEALSKDGSPRDRTEMSLSEVAK